MNLKVSGCLFCDPLYFILDLPANYRMQHVLYTLKKKRVKTKKMSGKKNNTFGKKIIPLFAKRVSECGKKIIQEEKKIIPQRSKGVSEWTQ